MEDGDKALSDKYTVLEVEQLVKSLPRYLSERACEMLGSRKTTESKKKKEYPTELYKKELLEEGRETKKKL